MRRGWWGLVVLVVVTVGGVVAVDLVHGMTAQPTGTCQALEVHVRELDGFRLGDGTSGSGATWGSVLTSGVTDIADADQARLAAAVRKDGAGFASFSAALPSASKPAAQRLHALVVDPPKDARLEDDPQVRRDLVDLQRLEARCGLAP